MERATTEGPVAAGSIALLAEVNAALGGTFYLVRPLQGGFQSGAWLVHDHAGQRAVSRWTPDRPWAEQIQRASRAVAVVRRCGYPTPAWLAAGVTGSGSGYQVQEYAPGRPREHLTEEAAHRAIDLLELQRDLDPDPGRSWSEYVSTKFRDEWTSTLSEVSAIGAAGVDLAGHAVRLLSRYEVPVLPNADLVHGDFRLSNLLFDEDTVSGVIDSRHWAAALVPSTTRRCSITTSPTTRRSNSWWRPVARSLDRPRWPPASCTSSWTWPCSCTAAD